VNGENQKPLTTTSSELAEVNPLRSRPASCRQEAVLQL